jgi:phosphatidylglycerophosphate synthase
MTTVEPLQARRPLRSRQTRWAAAAAARLTRLGVRPNTISLLGVGFAGLAGLCLVLSADRAPLARFALLLAAALGMQLRLVCNLLDGMVAIEGGARTKSGDVFNELPDRASDLLVLVSAGFSSGAVGWAAHLGWAAAVLATLTAYLRVFGGAVGLPQDFSGPMAKQQRMAVMTVACVASPLEMAGAHPGSLLLAALIIVAIGSAVTVARRTYRIVRALEAR